MQQVRKNNHRLFVGQRCSQYICGQLRDQEQMLHVTKLYMNLCRHFGL
jgi:hypothetical protein